ERGVVFIGFYKKVLRAQRGCVVLNLTLPWKGRYPTPISDVGRMSCSSFERQFDCMVFSRRLVVLF
ncbi:hypothetical protein, partial [Dialister hominis]|uniref:hypothetical protein n=1 Tax=Dialister hominis TaxID=2582419 RepID=UPI003FEF765D